MFMAPEGPSLREVLCFPACHRYGMVEVMRPTLEYYCTTAAHSPSFSLLLEL